VLPSLRIATQPALWDSQRGTLLGVGADVRVDELRAVMTLLLDAVESRFGAVVDLRADHYWLIGGGEAFDLTEAPELSVGQLSDDVAELRHILAGGEPLLWHDVAHVAGIIQRLASLDLPAAP
jgi:hypothetical protein